MALPQEFTGQSQALANYDFQDITTGTGTSRYYLGLIQGSGANAAEAKKILSPNIFYSDPIESTITSGTSAFSTIIDYDFDIDLKLPKTLRGPTILNIPMGIAKDSGGLYDTRAVCNIYRYDGTTETFVASGASALLQTSGAGSTAVQGTRSIYVDVPQTHFKKNDKIRLNILQYIRSDGAASGNWTLGHDPKNRAGTRLTTEDTNLIADVAFKIDL